MKRLINRMYLIIAFGFVLIFSCCKQAPKMELNVQEFQSPPKANSVHTWWHWLDNSITKEGITKDLEAMKKQGIQTATILDVSMLGEHDLGVPQTKFNTEAWYELFEWALKEANRLGMTLGVHNCDGWSSSGGPWIPPEYSMKRCVWSKLVISGGEETEYRLPEPKKNLDYYRDIRVLAFPSKRKASSFQAAGPDVFVNGKLTGDLIYDSDPFSKINISNTDEIGIVFKKDFTASRIAIHPRLEFAPWGRLEGIPYRLKLKVSADGKNFKMVQQIGGLALNKTSVIDIKLVTARYYKLEIKKVSGVDYNSLGISELELLGKDEMPGYNTAIPYHLEKTVTTMSNKLRDMLVQGSGSVETVPYSEIIDVTQYMTEDGILKWKAPAGNWTVLRIGYTTTGVQNSPATNAGRGLECDKMDTAALNLHFRNFPAKLITHAGKYAGNTFEYLFIDSWECRFQSWTRNFATEFEKRRHYSIVNWLPVICGVTVNDPRATERFLRDYQQTIAELIEENYYGHFNELCHKNGLKSHAEVIYGWNGYPPLDVLRSNGYIDVPMFEFWAWPDEKTGFLNYKPASRSDGWSLPVHAAALYNKKIVAAEAFTGFANYSESPWELKLFGDQEYCSGINQFVLHSYVHQPFEKKPGVTLGRYGNSFNRHNPWWDYASQWFTYMARSQYILQQGTPAADILYLTGDRYFTEMKTDGVYALPDGYTIQKCNLDILLNHCMIKDGKFQLDNGMNYEMLLLPDDAFMETKTLKRISEMVKSGAKVMGPQPSGVAGNLNYAENEKELNNIAGQMWGNVSATAPVENSYGKGKVFSNIDLKVILDKLKVKPDFSCDKRDTINLLYFHKKIGRTDIYFVVNQENKPIERECVFRITGKTPEIWDPQYGIVTIPAHFKESDGLTSVTLRFEPKESLFFVFENEKSPDLKIRKDFTEKYILKDLNGTLLFEDLPGKGPIQISQFSSWTTNSDPAIKYYSGKALYDLNFDLPSDRVNMKPVYICLDEVKSAYEINLNGKSLGCATFPGFRFDVTGLLKEKGNKLAIRVADTWRNRIIGDFTEFGELKNCWTTSPVTTLPGKDQPLQESGILGPVTLCY